MIEIIVLIRCLRGNCRESSRCSIFREDFRYTLSAKVAGCLNIRWPGRISTGLWQRKASRTEDDLSYRRNIVACHVNFVISCNPTSVSCLILRVYSLFLPRGRSRNFRVVDLGLRIYKGICINSSRSRFSDPKQCDKYVSRISSSIYGNHGFVSRLITVKGLKDE